MENIGLISHNPYKIKRWLSEMKMKKSLKTLLWILILVMSISLVAMFNSGGFTTTKGKIAIVSDRDGNEEIQIMNIDGSDQTRLTYNPADDYCLAQQPCD